MTYKILHSLQDLLKDVKNPHKSLIAFDIDFTLTHPNEPAFQFINLLKNKDMIQEVFQSLTPLERDLFGNLMVFHQTGNSLIESETPKLLNQLNEQGYRTVGLTASLNIELNNYNLTHKRVENLEKLGLYFSEFFETNEPMVFNQMSSNFQSHPVYHKGVLISNGENHKNAKGELLIEFLNSIDWEPEHIYFIDDRLPNLQIAHEALRDHKPNISYMGFHFLGALKFPSPEVEKKEFEEKIFALAEEARALGNSRFPETDLTES